jgi:5-methylthioadenosine/S-adenosylhomocysteine deaminase
MRILISNGYIITMDSDEHVYDRGYVLIQDDRIVSVGDGDLPETFAKSVIDKTIDASRRIVIPGLINCHLHSTADYWKGASDNLPLEPFILYAHPYATSLRLSKEQLYLRHMTSAIEMLESGTTGALDDTVHMPAPVDPRPEIALEAYRQSVEAALNCYKDVGMRALVTCNVHDRVLYETIPWLPELLPPKLKSELDERPLLPVGELEAFLDDVLAQLGGEPGSRVRLALAAGASTRCTDHLFTSLWGLAHKHRTQMVSHIQESKAEFVLDEQNYSSTAIAHLRDLGVLDERFGLIHAVWITDDDMDIIAASGSSVITNPVSNLKLGNGICPVLRLLARGAHIALGTDSPTANDSANMFGAMKMLAIVQRAWTSEFTQWTTASDVLRIATAGGAYALGNSSELGSIESGKRADITILDRENIAYIPFHRPIRQIVFSETGSGVDMVIVNGQVVVEDGLVTMIDRETILDEFRAAYQKILPDLQHALARSARYQPYLEQAYRRAAQVRTGVRPVLWDPE